MHHSIPWPRCQRYHGRAAYLEKLAVTVEKLVKDIRTKAGFLQTIDATAVVLSVNLILFCQLNRHAVRPIFLNPWTGTYRPDFSAIRYDLFSADSLTRLSRCRKCVKIIFFQVIISCLQTYPETNTSHLFPPSGCFRQVLVPFLPLVGL